MPWGGPLFIGFRMTKMLKPSPLDWTEDGQPRSRQFDNVYFSAENGLAEARAVYLDGCGLPDAWADRRRFVVGELGFGTGLNIAALLKLWRATRPADGQLHIFSIEAFPVSADEAARALSRWPELAEVSQVLISRWPGRANGSHRVELEPFDAILDVAMMDVREALTGWSGQADAWFLDGFAPAVNPQMWTDEVLALVGKRSAPGARAATFTVAGQVRRGLTAAGFTVDKRPGFGRKRERLEARRAGRNVEPPACRVAIVGAGVAGTAAARAVRALGAEAVVIETQAPGAGGSGNPAVLMTPRLDAGLGDHARLFAQAFQRAVDLYEAIPQAVISRGVLQLTWGERDLERFTRIANSDLFEPETMTQITAAAASERLGEPVPAALDQSAALVIAPAPALQAWAGDINQASVSELVQDEAGWRLLNADGEELTRANTVIVASALASGDLIAGLPVRPVRGQASWAPGFLYEGPASAWGGYILPTPTGVLFGATHDSEEKTVEVRVDDHARNIDILARALPGLAERLKTEPLKGRASIRAVTPDRLPLAGAAGRPGLFVLTGFGSRGFSLAPLLAEHVAALALGAPSPLSCVSAELVAPDRFARRAVRRSGS